MAKSSPAQRFPSVRLMLFGFRVQRCLALFREWQHPNQRSAPHVACHLVDEIAGAQAELRSLVDLNDRRALREFCLGMVDQLLPKES